MKSKLAFMIMLVLLQLTSVTSMTSGQSVSSRHKRHGDEMRNPNEGSELSGCGVTKGCFNQPPMCNGNDCTAYVTWQTMEDGQTNFTLWGQALGWVAVGLRPGDSSGRNDMIPAEVYACTKNNEVRRSENMRRQDNGKLDSMSRTIPNNTITVESAKFEDDVISCEFTRKPDLEGDSTFYNITGDNAYFILLAICDTIGTNGAIEKNEHKEFWSTSEAIKLQAHLSPVTNNNGAILRRAHASLMVIAWVGFASIGITMARYFKPMWPSSTLFGKKVWFTLHRACMVTCVGCSIAAIVLIVIHVEGFVETGPGNTIRVLHAIFGIIVIILAIVNPIMAVLRPHPGASKRPIFNWVHWGVGISAHLIGLATIFLGIGYQESLLTNLPRYVFFIMITFVAFHCVLWILFEIQRCMTESQGRSNDMPLNSVHGGGPLGDTTKNLLGTDPDSTGSLAKMLLLIIYILGIVIVVAFFVISFIIAEN